jgi:hypothetical protein
MTYADSISLLAQHDGGEWVNLVVILLFAIISAIGGLIKRHSRSRRPTDVQEPAPAARRDRAATDWRRRLQERLEQMQRGAEGEGEQETQGTWQTQPEPTPSAPASVEPSYTGEQERGAKEAIAAARNVVKTMRQAPEPMREPSEMPSEPSIGTTVAAAESEVSLDLTDPEALRRAIVQYEVLGKPLGLRDLPFELRE